MRLSITTHLVCMFKYKLDVKKFIRLLTTFFLQLNELYMTCLSLEIILARNLSFKVGFHCNYEQVNSASPKEQEKKKLCRRERKSNTCSTLIHEN